LATVDDNQELSRTVKNGDYLSHQANDGWIAILTNFNGDGVATSGEHRSLPKQVETIRYRILKLQKWDGFRKSIAEFPPSRKSVLS